MVGGGWWVVGGGWWVVGGGWWVVGGGWWGGGADCGLRIADPTCLRIAMFCTANDVIEIIEIIRHICSFAPTSCRSDERGNRSGLKPRRPTTARAMRGGGVGCGDGPRPAEEGPEAAVAAADVSQRLSTRLEEWVSAVAQRKASPISRATAPHA